MTEIPCAWQQYTTYIATAYHVYGNGEPHVGHCPTPRMAMLEFPILRLYSKSPDTDFP